MSDSLSPHGLQHARLLCPPPSLTVCSNSYPLGQWCHPTSSSSVTPFSICLQYFPAPGSFPMSCVFTSSGQTIGASALATVFPLNIQGLFPLGLTGLVSLQSKGLSRVFSSTTQFEGISSLAFGLLFGLTLTSVHDYWKNHHLLISCLYAFISLLSPWEQSPSWGFKTTHKVVHICFP